MKFTYKGEVFEYDELKLTTAEAEALKRYTGLTPKAYYTGISELDGAALRGLAWLGLRRNGHGVQFKDIEFDILEFAEGMSRDDADEEEIEDPPVPAGPPGTIQWPDEHAI